MCVFGYRFVTMFLPMPIEFLELFLAYDSSMNFVTVMMVLYVFHLFFSTEKYIPCALLY